MATSIVASSACIKLPLRSSTVRTGGVSGDVRVLDRPGADTTLGPVVVTLEGIDPRKAQNRAPQRVHITSSTDRFDPEFLAVADGDTVVFVNNGSLSHRLFSADLVEDIQIPLRPSASSAPFPIHHRGEVRFFCSLHPEENFRFLITAHVFSDVTDHNGWYDIGPLADGKYRLSIWSRRVRGPIRVVEVAKGRLSIEPVWIDPDLIRR